MFLNDLLPILAQDQYCACLFSASGMSSSNLTAAGFDLSPDIVSRNNLLPSSAFVVLSFSAFLILLSVTLWCAGFICGISFASCDRCRKRTPDRTGIVAQKGPVSPIREGPIVKNVNIASRQPRGRSGRN